MREESGRKERSRRRGHRSRSRSRSRSVEERRERRRQRSRSRSREEGKRRRNDGDKGGRRSEENLSDKTHVWGNVAIEEDLEAKNAPQEVKEEDKQKANFGLSGALAKDELTGNVYNGVVLKWTEPLDAKAPARGWRLYVFKEEEIVDTLHLYRQSAFLFGRDKRVADHILAHPSCSSQHAVIQFRYTSVADGPKKVKPYLMDLNSSNKTILNGKEIEDSRFIELRESDVIKFGYSSREYVLVNEKSHDSNSK